MWVGVVRAGSLSRGQPSGKLTRSVKDALAQFALPLVGQQRHRDLSINEIGLLRALVGHHGPTGAH